jgi:hypothetical protein
MTPSVQALGAFNRGGEYTSAEIAKLSGMSLVKTRTAVRRLVILNMISRVGSAYPPVYRLESTERRTLVERAIQSRPALQQAWGAA